MAGPGTTAGAALGNAFFPGAGGAVGGALGSLLDGGMTGSAGPPPGPQISSAAVYGSGLDGSGWNVNFGGTQSTGSNKNAQPPMLETLGLGAGGVMPGLSMPFVGSGGINSTYLLIGALVVGVVIWKKRSKR